MDKKDSLKVQTEKILKEKEKYEREVEETRAALKELIKDGRLPKARPMTRGERKKLDKEGININAFNADSKLTYAQMRDKMVDFILDVVYPEFNFDDLSNAVCLAFATYIYALSYEDKIATKN